AGQRFPDPEPTIMLVARAEDSQTLDRLVRFTNNQSWQNFTLFVQASFDVSMEGLPKRIQLMGDDFFIQDFNPVLKKYDFFGHLDPRAAYGPHYLQDLVNASRYAPEAEVLGKSPGDDHFDFDQPVHGYACVKKTSGFSGTPSLRPAQPVLQGPKIFCLDAAQFRPSDILVPNQWGKS
ncbi:MAG: hypothetical protein ACOC15_00585, partial [Desulfovibrionales bacterium]